MKTHTYRFTVLAAIAFSLVSCDLSFGALFLGKTGSLTLGFSSNGQGPRTVMPNVDLDIAYYEVSGDGPGVSSFTPERPSGTSFTKSGLAVGSWIITVKGYNGDDVQIGEGSAIVIIESGAAAYETIYVSLLGGTGTLEIHVSWPSGVLLSPSAVADIIAPDQSFRTVIFTSDPGGLSASWSDSGVAIGSHLISVIVKEGLEERRCVSEDFYVVSGGTTSGSYAFTADQLLSGVSKPRLSLSGGAYSGTQTLTIACDTSGATIRYTENGTIPDEENGIDYPGSISIPTSRIITAVALKDGQPSVIARAVYTITGTIAVPQIGKRPGAYYDPIGVTLSCSTPSAVIMYTTNGNDPGAFSGEMYSGVPISISSDTAIKALARNSDGSLVSTITQANYRITGHTAVPEASIEAGTYYAGQSVELSCASSGAVIRFTIDETEPSSTTGSLYGGAIPITQSTTIKAKAFLADWADSDTIVLPIELKIPEVTIAPGTNTSDVEFNAILTKSMAEADIRYTVNGDTPNASVGEDCVTGSELFGYVYIDHTLTLQAVAIRDGWTDSDVSTAVYTMKCAMPSFTPEAGSYGDASFTVTMVSTTPGYTIVSTIDGYDPVMDVRGALGPTRTLSSATTIRAIAARSGWTSSDVNVGAFTPSVMAISPVSGATVYGSTPLIDWPNRAAAVSYEIELAATESGFTGNSPVAAAASNYQIAEALADSQTVWWRTRTVDAANAKGAWSTASSFTYHVLVPEVLVEGGTFQMGSALGEADEQPVHEVTVSSLRIGKFEVTQGAYIEIMGTNPSFFTGDLNRPVERVTWYDAIEFCNQVSVRNGLEPVYTITNRVPASGYPITSATVTADWTKSGWRLPTEAEWEYAARAGTATTYYWGDASNVASAGTYSWIVTNAGSSTHPVGQKSANAFGLFDTLGNVREWCWDLYGSYPSARLNDPKGSESGSSRVERGGAISDEAVDLGTARRYPDNPYAQYSGVGMRPVRAANPGLAIVSGLSPAGGEEVLDTTPLLNWDDAQGAGSYDIQIAGTVGALSGAEILSSTVSEYQTTTEIPNGETRYWRVRSRTSGNEAGVWCVPETFSVSIDAGVIIEDYNDTPPEVTLSGVASAIYSGENIIATASSSFPGVSWSWYMDGSVISGATGSTYSFAADSLSLGYHSITARATIGTVSGSKLVSFQKIDTDDPWEGIVTGMTPANGATITDSTPLLDWSNTTSAESYELQIASTSTALASSAIITCSSSNYQVPAAFALGQMKYWRVCAVSGLGLKGAWSSAKSFTYNTLVETVFISGGTFQMGSSAGFENELPIHTVTLSPFLIGKYEVTQAQYQEVMGSNPSYFQAETTRPVEQITWYNALVFCNKLSMLEGFTPVYSISGKTNPADWGAVPTSSNGTWDAAAINANANGYRLPTEAEWEFAARGGLSSDGYTYVGSNDLDTVAWHDTNSGGVSHIVGTKTANELGLFDMSGNVWEWCWDWFGSYGAGALTNPTGPSSGTQRILRGACWYLQPTYCRSTLHYAGEPYINDPGSGIGIRVVRSACGVSYSPNGATAGSAPVDTTEYNPGQTVTVAANSDGLARIGHAFEGWNTKADGTGTTHAAGSGSFAIPETGMMLYAKWTLNASAYTDEFNSSTLDAKWTVLNNEVSYWNLTSSPGTLLLHSLDGEFIVGYTHYSNLFVEDAPGGDFSVCVRVSSIVDPSPGSQIRLILYQDADNYVDVAYARSYDGGYGFIVEETSGAHTYNGTADSAYLSSIYLLMTRQGTSYYGYTSTDGATWTSIGTVTNSITFTKIGLWASNGVGVPASGTTNGQYFIDYIRFGEVGSFGE